MAPLCFSKFIQVDYGVMLRIK